MKIVIDARESGTTTGRYVDKLIEYLHKLKPEYDITILTKTPRIEFIKSIAPDFEVVESNFKEFTFAEQIGLLRQLNSLKPDLVHFSMPQQPALYRGRAVTTIHDLTTIYFRNPSKNWLVFMLKQQVYKWLIKRVAKRSERLLAISNFTKNDIAQFASVPAAKIIVTYEAADKIAENPEPIASLLNKKFIMYVGRPQPHKNLEKLVEAFASLKTAYPDLKLVLVGKQDRLYERLQKQVEKQKITGVVFTGFVSEGTLHWLYENTAAYVFPSLSEGFGLPALEALAHGAPVVSSNATCLPEIYGDAALYFDPEDIKDIAQKIKTVLEDPKIVQRLHLGGPGQAAKYSWQRTAQQTLEVYKSVLG